MTNVWCVHADEGTYTDQFVNGGYIGYGRDWPDLSSCENRDDIRQKLEEKQIFESGTSKYVVGAYVGMMARFLFDIQVGDWVITPLADRWVLRYGKGSGQHSCYSRATADGYPASMRRKIDWADKPLDRETLSTAFQRTLKNTQRSVFAVKHREEFLVSISRHRPTLDKLLRMNEAEFEMLVGTALKHKGWKISK